MNNSRKITVTVAIPAYNEEKNIRQLIHSIFKQKVDKYILNEVKIISDDSTDKTNTIVKQLQKEYSKLYFEVNETRIGKSSTMNKIIKQNTSDIIIFFDADIQLANREVLENIVNEFEKTGAEVVGGVDKPVIPKTFFERVTYTWATIWDTIRLDKRNGSDLFRLSARVMAIKKSFADQLTIPETVLADDQYIYVKAMLEKRTVSFAEKAVIHYKIPSTFKDYLTQSCRYISLMNNVPSHFSTSVYKYFMISKSAKKEAMRKIFLQRPVYTVISLILQIVVRFSLPLMGETHKKTVWVINNSTK